MSMNRKQRRLQDKKQGKPKAPSRKQQDDAALAAELKAQGMALKSEGKEAEAEAVPLFKKALQLDSSLADVHFALAMLARTKPELGVDMEEVNEEIKEKKYLLGSYSAIMVVLRQKRQYKEAVICQEEICRLRPDDAWALFDLGLLLNIAGQGDRAAIELSRALNLNPDDKVIKGLYSISLQNPHFSEFCPEVRQAMLECFKNIYDVHLRNFWAPWFNHMLRDPQFSSLCAARTMDEESLVAWIESLDENTGAFLSDPYLTGGLRLLIIADGLFEHVLTRLRRYLCLNYESLESSKRISIFEKFSYALAQQCFFNEYVYEQKDDEIVALNTLTVSRNRSAIALAACYKPLYESFAGKHAFLEELAQNAPDFSELVKIQLGDHIEEERIKPTIPVFGEFANRISRTVQNQYEENPYPRWTTIATTTLPNDDMVFGAETKNLPFNILIAGCGTGRHAIGAAIRYPKARIVAIDLSRASLAYGIRKSQECGTDKRIKFLHADILSMKDWPEQFDIIECVGVLHHMEDPFEGWATLNSILKPNGLFKIGFYSELARQPIIKARDFIAQNGFPSTPEGIRACRQAILRLPTTDHIYNFVSKSIDFYTMSAVRDLIFHVQEHRMTLPQIKDMMDRLGLVSIKVLTHSPDILFKYDKMFPNDVNRKTFENWEKFEKKYPLTFAGMYQFWCQKTA